MISEENSNKINKFQMLRSIVWPYVRLLSIGLSVLIMGTIALYAARQVGLSWTLTSPLASEASGPWVFRLPGDGESNPFSRPAILAALNAGGTSVPVLELRASQDGVWYFWGEDDLDLWTNGHGRIEMLPSSEIEKLRWLKEETEAGGPVPLLSIAEVADLNRVALIVRHKDPAFARSLVQALGERESPKMTFAFSPYHIFNRELRKLRPNWYFGADQAQLSQWHLFAAFGLEPFASSDFDWIILDLENASPAHFAPRVWQEILRRKIPAIWKGPPFPEKMPSTLLGIMTNRPNQTLETLDSQ